MTNVRTQIENKMDKGMDGVDTVMDQAKDFVKDHMPGSLDEVKETALDTIKKGKTQVKKSPGQSMLIAIGIGFGLGMLFDRARAR